MMRCRKYRNLMVDALYDGLPAEARKDFDKHLAVCTKCSQEYARLQGTLTVLSRKEQPQADSGYWQNYWQRLSGRLHDEPDRAVISNWLGGLIRPAQPRSPTWIGAAAAILILLTGIFIGREIAITGIDRKDSEIAAAGVFAPGTMLEFNRLAERYLERSKTLLLGLGNFDHDEDDLEMFDFPLYQYVSQEVVRQGRVLRDHPVAFSNEQIQRLISELEPIFLQLANSEDESLEWTIQLIQNGMENHAILLKINLTALGY